VRRARIDRARQGVIELRRARTRAGLFDCIVAATALGAGLPVYTEDRDFEVLRDHDAGPDVVLG
jgi:predicted nucleic acid-binding protein